MATLSPIRKYSQTNAAIRVFHVFPSKLFSFKLIFKAFSCLFVLFELWHRELWFIRLKQPIIRLVGFLITVCSYFFTYSCVVVLQFCNSSSAVINHIECITYIFHHMSLQRCDPNQSVFPCVHLSCENALLSPSPRWVFWPKCDSYPDNVGELSTDPRPMDAACI